MLINFVNIFQIIYEGFKCKLKFVQGAFMNKTFCMQKNKPKHTSVSAFLSCLKRINVGFIKNQSWSKLFPFNYISNLVLKD